MISNAIRNIKQGMINAFLVHIKHTYTRNNVKCIQSLERFSMLSNLLHGVLCKVIGVSGNLPLAI